MASPERITITPQGRMDSPIGESRVDLLGAVVWLVLASSLIGDLALAFQGAAGSLRLGFGAITAISALALFRGRLSFTD